MATLQQQLLSAIPESLVDLGFVCLNIGDIGFRMTGNPVKIAEFAIGNADIGGVYIPVDDPGDLAVRNLLLPELVGNEHQIGKGSIFKEKNAFFNRQKPKIQRFVVQVINIHIKS